MEENKTKIKKDLFRGTRTLKSNSKNRGITLIALVITIAVLLVLAGITIKGLTTDGLIGKTDEASFKSKISSISEDLEMYKAGLLADSKSTEVNAGEILKEIIAVDELEIDETTVGDIKTISNSVGKTEKQYLMIMNGELYYVSQNSVKNNENQIKWCNDLGISVYDFTPATGIKKTNGDYELVNGLYVCTPKLSTGFDKKRTRYIYERNANLAVGTWINKKPESDWYDYKEQKWANIFVENEGIESYYVWIPRYVYKIPTGQNASTARVDIKFVDVNNNYIDGATGKKTSWNTLQSQGYKLPDAFWWDNNGNGTQDATENLSGYWMSKYELSESTKYPINYALTTNSKGFKISNITIDTNSTIQKYTYAINGKIVYESNSPSDYLFPKNIAKKISTINVTALDANGEIVASMTKEDEMIEVNSPELKGFNPENTYYVYWDENDVEHNDIPISQKQPDNWYDYAESKWANIVTKGKDKDGNQTLSYFVWIPRYQYQLNETNKTTKIKFLSGIDTKTETGYKIPDAFTWTQGNEEKQLRGYWISKYELSE